MINESGSCNLFSVRAFTVYLVCVPMRSSIICSGEKLKKEHLQPTSVMKDSVLYRENTIQKGETQTHTHTITITMSVTDRRLAEDQSTCWGQGDNWGARHKGTPLHWTDLIIAH